MEYSIAAAKNVKIVKPPNTIEAVKEIVASKGILGLYQVREALARLDHQSLSDERGPIGIQAALLA